MSTQQTITVELTPQEAAQVLKECKALRAYTYHQVGKHESALLLFNLFSSVCRKLASALYPPNVDSNSEAS